MPKVKWNVPTSVISDFDRDAQFAPYTGPAVPNGVYRFLVKKLTYVAGTREQNPQLRVGLQLVPRNSAEKRYKGYYTTAFLNIDPAPKMAFIYVPFLDAIGVDANEFVNGTITDEQGNVQRMGRWRNKGTTEVLAQLKANSYVDKTGATVTGQQVGWFGAYDPDADEDQSDVDDEDFDDEDVDPEDVYDDEEIGEEDEYADDELGEEEEYEEEPEPEPAPRRRKAAPAPVAKRAAAATAAPKRRRAAVEDEPF